MKVMVLADRSFARREHQLLTRLEIGLADEGASVVHAVPTACVADPGMAFSSTLVTYDDSPTPFGRSARRRSLLKDLAERLDVASPQVDVVHVFGTGAWGLGFDAAQELGAQLVVEVWRAELVEDAKRLARMASEGAGGRRAGLITSSAKIGELLGLADGGALTSVAPWGVPVGEGWRGPIDMERGIALSVLAEGRMSGELKNMLEGIKRAADRLDNLLVFLDGAAADRSVIWRAARKLGLLGRVTAVAEMEARREPILQTDLLLLPEPMGVCRTLPLSAMADGVSVIGRPDDVHAGWLAKGTATLVNDAVRGRPATPEAWERAIVQTVQDREGTTAMREAARAYVRKHRTVTAYVEGVRHHYAQVCREPAWEVAGATA